MVMVLPTAIGRCEVVEGITENEIRSGIGTVLALAGDES
jgi:hypothetical protein